MRFVFFLMLTLLFMQVSSQVLEVKIQQVPANVIQSYKAKADSLSKLYGKSVFGYRTNITIDSFVNETFMIYVSVKGEVSDSIVWKRELRSNGKITTALANVRSTPSLHENLSIFAYPIHYENSYIGFIKNGLFYRVTEADGALFRILPKPTKDLLSDKVKLESYLHARLGGSYQGQAN